MFLAPLATPAVGVPWFRMLSTRRPHGCRFCRRRWDHVVVEFRVADRWWVGEVCTKHVRRARISLQAFAVAQLRRGMGRWDLPPEEFLAIEALSAELSPETICHIKRLSGGKGRTRARFPGTVPGKARP